MPSQTPRFTIATCSSTTSQLHLWHPPSTTPHQTHSNCTLTCAAALLSTSTSLYALIRNPSNTTSSLLIYPPSGPPTRHSLPDPTACCLAATPGFLAIGSRSGRVHVWTECGVLLTSFFAHFRGVVCMAFSDDGEVLLTAGNDGVCKVYVLGELVDLAARDDAVASARVIEGHMLPISALCIGVAGVGGRVVTGGRDGWVKVWHLGSGRCIGSFKVAGVPVGVAFGGGEAVLYVGVSSGDVVVVAVEDLVEGGVIGEGKRVLRGGGVGGVSALTIGGGGEIVVVGYEGGVVRVFEGGSGVLLSSYSRHGTAPVDAVVVMERSWGWRDMGSRVLERLVDEALVTKYKPVVELGGGLDVVVADIGKMAVDMAYAKEAEEDSGETQEEMKRELDELRRRNRELEDAGRRLIELVEAHNASVGDMTK